MIEYFLALTENLDLNYYGYKNMEQILDFPFHSVLLRDKHKINAFIQLLIQLEK